MGLRRAKKSRDFPGFAPEKHPLAPSKDHAAGTYTRPRQRTPPYAHTRTHTNTCTHTHTQYIAEYSGIKIGVELRRVRQCVRALEDQPVCESTSYESQPHPPQHFDWAAWWGDTSPVVAAPSFARRASAWEELSDSDDNNSGTGEACTISSEEEEDESHICSCLLS